MSTSPAKDFPAALSEARLQGRQAMQELAEDHLPLVAAMVRRFPWHGREREELYQQGCVGLMKALARYDPSLGTSFSTYAAAMILGEMRMLCRMDAPVHVPRRDRELRSRVRRTERMLTQHLGRDPTVQELASFSNIRICLEGVETEKQLRLLNDLQPDIYQGYLFSRPVEAPVFTASFVDNGADAYADYNTKVQRFTSLDVQERMLDSHLLWNLMYDDPGYDIVHNNSENILRDLELGLWIIRMEPGVGHYEMFLDKNCAEILSASKALSPQECYKNWFEKITPECKQYVLQMVSKMINSGKIVQLEYNWQHPKAGVVRMRCVGIRTTDSNGMVTLKGYHRVISNIIQTSYLDVNI